MFQLCIAGLIIGSFSSVLATPANRTEKQVATGLFNVVTFPNDPCKAINGYNGTCMSKSECLSTGGELQGGCAQGFGACCFYYTEACGSNIYYNQTYVRNTDFPQVVKATTESLDCKWKIYRLNDNICKVRFDFDTFDLGPPKHSDSATFSCETGSTDVVEFTHAGVQWEYFRICGYNKGHHVYVDMNDPNSNIPYATMSVHLDSSHWGTYNRNWNIMVSQIECGQAYTPPHGCGQYYYGNGGSGLLLAFNYDQPEEDYYAKLLGIHTICIRREQGMCAISYVPPDVAEDQYGFSINGAPTVTRGRKACSNKEPGVTAECTDDFISIPGGTSTGYPEPGILLSPITGTTRQYNTCDRFCARRLCNLHQGCIDLDHQIVTSRRMPFEVRVFFSDHSTTNVLKGFKLNYWQTKC